jgi:hypothetical protein
MFCAGHTFLTDGQLLVAGGHDEGTGDGHGGDGHGIDTVNVYNAGVWNLAPPMSVGRWYPTTTTMPNGDVVAVAGTDNNAVDVAVPELYSNGTWSRLERATQVLPWYPRNFVDPRTGYIYSAGQSRQTRWLDPYYVYPVNGTRGRWILGPQRGPEKRDYGTAVAYRPGKIMYAGGGDPPTKAVELIDLNQASPQWSYGTPMAFARRHLNATSLPDGKVLVTNGTSGSGFSNLNSATHEAELWDPDTGQWTLLAEEAVTRVYHSTTLLLPDARILSSGSGDIEGGTIPRQTNMQIFTPPYLFNPDGSLATRPTITGISATTLHYGQPFTINTPDAALIARVSLIRYSAVTHSFNESQVFYPVVFTAGAGVLNAAAIPNGRVAPPGPYLLFLVDTRGVPSIASTVMVTP